LRPCLGGGEQLRVACRFPLLRPALFLRAGAGRSGRRGDPRRRHGLAGILRVEDRAAEIAGQRRAEFGHAAIILRQAGQPVRRGAVVGGNQFLTLIAAMPGLERIDQRAADADTGGEAKTSQHLARQAGDARRLGAQPHRRDRLAGQRPGHHLPPAWQARSIQLATIFLFGMFLAHDAGLPSVREMRTRF
jgi:hypothetical protein